MGHTNIAYCRRQKKSTTGEIVAALRCQYISTESEFYCLLIVIIIIIIEVVNSSFFPLTGYIYIIFQTTDGGENLLDMAMRDHEIGNLLGIDTSDISRKVCKIFFFLMDFKKKINSK